MAITLPNAKDATSIIGTTVLPVMSAMNILPLMYVRSILRKEFAISKTVQNAIAVLTRMKQSEYGNRKAGNEV
jgi:hypothetical protein